MNDETGVPDAALRALHLLSAIGWNYLGPETCQQRRSGKRSLLLESTLIDVLRARRFEYRNQLHLLSAGAIDQIVRELSVISLQDGLLAANQRLHEKLVHGITVTEFMADGTRFHPTISVIDWRNPTENRFDVTDRFEILPELGLESRTMDVVGFVNGIPLMVMTCGRDGQAALGQGIGRQLQDQLPGAVPMLYAYAQLLLSVNAGDGVYGTTLSVPARWGRWREEEFGEAHFARLEKTVLPAEVRQALEAGRGDAVKMALRQLWPSQGTPDGLDRLLVGLLSPVRLLAFIRSYLVFDREKGKLAARCEQFFATRAVLTRISHRRIGGLRDGGILWHKNGTGKSMLLLFVANALLLQDSLKACRMVIIPDSTGLRDRLVAQFMKRDAFDPVTGMKKRKPKVLSGRNLANRIGSGSERVLIASVAKFTIAAELATCRNFSDNLIVLTEESPRRPMAENRRRLRKALPRSAWIAVSGEPLQADRVMGEFPGTLIHAYPLDDVGAGALRMEMRQPESQYTVGETPLASGLPEPAGAQPAVDFTEAGAAPASRQAAPAQEFLTGDQGPTEDGAAALARLSPTAWRVALPWLATGEQEAGDDAAGCDSQTRIIDEVVRAAVIANSLNPQNIEADIRRSLLPVLFGQVGMEKARQAIDDVLKILRAHFGRMAA